MAHLCEPSLFIGFLLSVFQLARHFLGALLDPLHAQLLVSVTFLQVAHGEQDWVFGLFSLLLHLLVELGVEHLKCGHADTVTLVAATPLRCEGLVKGLLLAKSPAQFG